MSSHRTSTRQSSAAVPHPSSPHLPLTLQLWTEGSSLRHTPEALWFFYHVLAMDPAIPELWAHPPPQSLLASSPGPRDRRLAMRNILQVSAEAGEAPGRGSDQLVLVWGTASGCSAPRDCKRPML